MEQEQQSFVRQVREALARRRLTRQWLAYEARISLSTLEKALSGERPLTLATRLRVEAALGIGSAAGAPPPPAPAAAADVAPPELGAYSRRAVAWMEGDYLTLRPSFATEGAVFAYRTMVEWSDAASGLVFAESERVDAAYAQHGLVSMPHQSGHVYLVTNETGQYRIAILDRPGIDGVLNGVLLTLQSRRGAQLVPVATPLALVPLRRWPDPVFGLIEQGHPQHESCRRRLDAIVSEEFARFVL
ncbi:MAG TPA: transcriptional regulator [Allosphingosinicella sp.]|nr:transcriptional regulator [Allosphingosinicella sp.]